MVKWKGYGIEECTFEPAAHIPVEVRTIFDNPLVSNDRLSSTAEAVTRAVQTRLSSRNTECIVHINFDVFRFLFGDVKEKLVFREEFKKLPLSKNWYFKLNCKGEGLQVHFPVRVTRRLVMKPVCVKSENGILTKKITPVERMKIICAVSACSVDSLS